MEWLATEGKEKTGVNNLINSAINMEGRKEWRENWPLVAASMTGFSVAVVHIYSLGIMIAPLEAEFGWPRSIITSGYLIVSIVMFFFAPVVGMVIDRFGPRCVALCGVVIYCLSLSLLSLSQQAVWTWWLLWLILAFGAVALKPTVWISAISSLFSASRGLAIAVALSATGIVSSGAPLLTYWFLEHFGWRMAYVLWGIIAAVMALPMIVLFFHSAKDDARKVEVASSTGVSARGWQFVRMSLKSAVFVKLAAAGAIMSLVFSTLIVGLVPIMASRGLDKATAAAIAGVVGFSQIFGRVMSGFLLDRFNARVVTAIAMGFPAATCLLYIISGASIPFAIVAALLFGLSVGAELDAISYLASRYFGIGNFGTLFGTMVGFIALGGGLGPVVSNLVYDLMESYVPVLWTIVPLALLSAYMVLTLGPYPETQEIEQRAAHS